MGMLRKSFLVVFLIFLTPSTLFAGVGIKTGYDLYNNIQRMDNPQSLENASADLYTTGYLAGYLDDLAHI